MTTSKVRVDFALFDGFDELDVSGPAEALYLAAARGMPLDIAKVTISEQEVVTGSHGTRWIPDGVHRPDVDILVIPGGRGINREIETEAWFPAIQKVAASDGTLVSVCTGARLLAAAGVVGERRITTHHFAYNAVADTGATVLFDRVVDDGDLVSSGGITAGIDLGLWLVERLAGQAKADQIADVLEYYQRFRPLAG